jgi:hypothetical protein
MKILAFITDFATARAIRRSLKLPAQEPEPLAHGPPHEIGLRLPLPRSAARPGSSVFANADSWGGIHSILTTHLYRPLESGPTSQIAQLRSYQLP